MNDQENSRLEQKITFPFGQIFVETDKNVYYPGEAIEGAIHLKTHTHINNLHSISLRIFGEEYFKFTSTTKNKQSLLNRRTVIDERVVICNFQPAGLAPSDYTFAFKYKIPDTSSWPASFHMKRTLSSGFLLLHTKYKLLVKLEKPSV